MRSCRAAGCSEDHSAHFCKVCRDKDADHTSGACPRKLLNVACNPNFAFNPPSRRSSGGGCRAVGCTEDHAQHFCKVCRDKDADHTSGACPRLGSGIGGSRAASRTPSPTASRGSRCRAAGCTEGHAQHFCKVCRDKDADHTSDACPRALAALLAALLAPSPTASRGSRCRVAGCTEDHAQHFCKVCRDKDADHMSSACRALLPPGGRRLGKKELYHVTDAAGARGISSSGKMLRGTTGGAYGNGIYLADSPQHASHKAKRHGFLVTVIADLGVAKEVGPPQDFTYHDLRAQGYHSVYSPKGPSGGGAAEYVVYNYGQLHVLRITPYAG